MLAADIYGKIKTVLLDVGVALLILGGFHVVLAAIAEAIFYLGAVMTVVSGVNYLVKNKHVLADPEKKEQAPAAADVKEAAADKVENENK